MKYLFAIALAASITAHAEPSDIGQVIGRAAACNDVIDIDRYHTYLTKSFGEPIRREGGAVWWRVGATIMNVKATEVFVADREQRRQGWRFIGIVFDGKPLDVAAQVTKVTGDVFKPVDSRYTYSALVSQNHSEILWANTKSKLVCKVLSRPENI